MDEKERKRFFNSRAREKILIGLKSKYREVLNSLKLRVIPQIYQDI